MRRGRRASARQRVGTAAFNRYQIWVAILVVMLIQAIQPAFGILAKTGSFLDDASIRRCLENLHAADVNKNDELSTYEYITFIDLESYGKIHANAFADLPLNLVLIYYFIACLCSQDGGGQNCCVGDSAAIDIVRKNGRPLYTQTFCSLVELGIYDALNPTPPPSLVISAMPSIAPNFLPTPTYIPSPTPIFVHPSKRPSKPPPTPKPNGTTKPTESPSVSPVFTSSPTVSPTASPTAASTKFPTTSPSKQPVSLAPTPQTPQPSMATAKPTVAPTAQTPAPIRVTSAPTAFQTAPPPTVSPSVRTASPTRQTASPTLTPVVPPSPKPQTVAPTTLTPVAPPTLAPVTAQPTVRGLTCVSFQYGLSNQAGLNAFDILHMVNNTLRTGFLVATRNITIEILNSTFPRTPKLGAGAQANSSAAIFQKFLLMLQQPSDSRNAIRQPNGGNRRTLEDRSGIVQIAIEHALTDLYPNSNAKRLLQSQIDGMYRRNALLVETKIDLSREMVVVPMGRRGSRRLVYYSDAFPVTINDIFDNPICPKNTTPPTLCAVVSTTVCVLLENGENATTVDNLLLQGFQNAVNKGLLQDAIPPENQV